MVIELSLIPHPLALFAVLLCPTDDSRSQRQQPWWWWWWWSTQCRCRARRAGRHQRPVTAQVFAQEPDSQRCAAVQAVHDAEEGRSRRQRVDVGTTDHDRVGVCVIAAAVGVECAGADVDGRTTATGWWHGNAKETRRGGSEVEWGCDGVAGLWAGCRRQEAAAVGARTAVAWQGVTAE